MSSSKQTKKIEIKKSYSYAKIKTGIVGITAVVVLIFTYLIIRYLNSITFSDTTAIALLLYLIILVIAGLSIMVSWSHSTQKKYFLDNKSIIIEKSGIGLTGKTSQEIISPNNISRIKLEKSSLGNMFNYGTIIIETNHINKEIYQLVNIKEPEKVITELRTRL